MKLSKHIFLATLITLTLFSCKEEKKQKKEVLRPVRYQVVGGIDVQRTRTFSGVAKAGDEIELSFRSSGVISEVKVSKGQKVKQGDLIAKLDNVEANLAYEQSVSSLNSAQSAMNTSQSELNRVKSLYEKGSKSLSEYEQARNAYQNALAQFESAKRNKGIQATQLSYGIIRAPKDGLIADTDGGVGERVSGGHQFAILNAGEGMKIEIGLPESIVNKVTAGMKADINFTAIENTSFKGTVLEVAPIVDEDAATFTASVGIDTPTEAIKPGMAANVAFSFETDSLKSDAIIIPMKSVGEDKNGNFVFVIESADGKTGTTKKQSITIGELTPNGFEIKSGLSKGQKIATAGLQTLLDGQKVKLQQ